MSHVGSIVGWLGLGVLVGFVASRLYDCTGDDFILDIVLGVVGAIGGGGIFSLFGRGGGNTVNLYSLLVAVIGAAIVPLIYHVVVGRRTL